MYVGLEDFSKRKHTDEDMAGLDLHDLNDLRSRSLVFIHNLVNSLRESGVRRLVLGGSRHR